MCSSMFLFLSVLDPARIMLLPCVSDFLVIVSLLPHLFDVTCCVTPYDVWVIQESVVTWQALLSIVLNVDTGVCINRCVV